MNLRIKKLTNGLIRISKFNVSQSIVRYVNYYFLSLKVVDNLTNEEHVYYNRKEVPCKKFNVSTPQLLFVSSKITTLYLTIFGNEKCTRLF